MKRIIRYAALLLMLVFAALSLGGCMDYSALTTELEAEETEQPEATPLPPLTDPLIESREDFFRYFNQVSLMDTLDDLKARFPDAEIKDEESENMYSFIFADEYGFAVVFDESGAMLAKVPYYKDLRQLKPIASGKNFDQISLLSKGQSYTTAASLFGGKGLEIMQMPPESPDAQGVRRLYLWIDDSESTVQALFDETGAYVSGNLGSFSE